MPPTVTRRDTIGGRSIGAKTLFPKTVLEVVEPRPLVRDGVSAARPRSRSKASLSSRIAVIGNYLPRHCGIATFTTDLCEAISAEYGTARLLALPVNDTEQGYDYPARARWSAHWGKHRLMLEARRGGAWWDANKTGSNDGRTRSASNVVRNLSFRGLDFQ